MKPHWDAVYVVWFCIGTGFGVLLGCAITLNYAMRTFRRWDRERYRPNIDQYPWRSVTTTTVPASTARFNPEDLSVLGSSDPPPTEEIKLHDQP